MEEKILKDDLAKTWRQNFEHVYCVSYAPYKKRREKLFEELKRVGIIHSELDGEKNEPFFSMHYTVENPFEQMLLTHPGFNWPKHNKRFNKGALSLALGHYCVMKEAMSLGYLRILIIEDDIVFLKDLSVINDIIENIPLSDVIMYDKVVPSRAAWENDLSCRRSRDWNYVLLSKEDIVWTTSCYSVDAAAMWHITECQEKSFNVADYYTNAFAPTKDYSMIISPSSNIIRSASVKSIACQRPSEETISDHGSTNSVYNQIGLYDCGINFEEYNL